MNARTVLAALLEGAALAFLSIVLMAVFLGRTAGVLLQFGLLGGYLYLLRRKRTAGQRAAAVAVGAFLLGLTWWFMTSSSKPRGGRTPQPATVMMVRSALEDYRAAHKIYPARLEDLTPQYLALVPVIEVGTHAASDTVEAFGAEICAPGGPNPAKARDTGHWGYVSDPKSPCWGGVFIDCTHKDPDGRAYFSY